MFAYSRNYNYICYQSIKIYLLLNLLIIMKKVLLLAATILSVALFTACESSGNPSGNITVNPGTLNFTAAGGSEYAAVTGSDWTVTSNNPSWITAVKEGNSVKVTVGAATQNRTGSVTVASSTDSKVINVVQTAGATIDDLVGSWTVSGYFLQYNEEEENYDVADNAHTVTITKVNETTLKAANIFGFRQLYGDAVFDQYFDDASEEVTITFNSDGTINLPRQEILPTIDPDDWRTYLCRYLNEELGDNWNIGFENVPVTNNTINWSTGGFEFGTLTGGEVLYASYVVLTRATPTAAQTYYNEGYFMNTVWTKGGAGAPVKAKAETFTISKKDFESGKFNF